MPMLGVVAANTTDAERSQIRQSQLREIMEDAVESVLERPDTRRGPYVIADSDLRFPSALVAR